MAVNEKCFCVLAKLPTSESRFGRRILPWSAKIGSFVASLILTFGIMIMNFAADAQIAPQTTQSENEPVRHRSMESQLNKTGRDFDGDLRQLPPAPPVNKNKVRPLRQPNPAPRVFTPPGGTTQRPPANSR